MSNARHGDCAFWFCEGVNGVECGTNSLVGGYTKHSWEFRTPLCILSMLQPLPPSSSESAVATRISSLWIMNQSQLHNITLSIAKSLTHIVSVLIVVTICSVPVKASDNLMGLVFMKSPFEKCIPPVLVWKYEDNSIHLEVYRIHNVLQSTLKYMGVVKNKSKAGLVVPLYNRSYFVVVNGTMQQFLFGAGCVNWMAASIVPGNELNFPALPGMHASSVLAIYTYIDKLDPQQVATVNIEKMESDDGYRLISPPPYTLCNCIAYGVVPDSLKSHVKDLPSNTFMPFEEAVLYDYRPHYDCGSR